MLMLTIGFTIGLLSEDPDGLERTLIDVNGEHWLEGLPSPWDPIFGWIQNDYIAGLLGTILSIVLIMSVFELVFLLKKRKRNS